MNKRHGWCFPQTLYALAVLVPVGCTALAVTWIIAAADGLPNEREPPKTVLDIRVESAREIRRALASPVLLPEPLGPIKAAAANASGGAKGLSLTAARSRRQPAEARNAFASGAPDWTAGVQATEVRSFDRHTRNLLGFAQLDGQYDHAVFSLTVGMPSAMAETDCQSNPGKPMRGLQVKGPRIFYRHVCTHHQGGRAFDVCLAFIRTPLSRVVSRPSARIRLRFAACPLS